MQDNEREGEGEEPTRKHPTSTSTNSSGHFESERDEEDLLLTFQQRGQTPSCARCFKREDRDVKHDL